MIRVISRLETYVETIPGFFRSLNLEEMVLPRSEGKWSRLQILGHLCDSAVNNLNRFIRVQEGPEPYIIEPYNQTFWVEAEGYKHAPPEHVLSLWLSLNQAILRVLKRIPETRYSHKCRLSNGETLTLETLAGEYLFHIEHHLKQLFGEDFLQSHA
ncbi:DinB family protein [Gorillibacterium massiliense]|uniref:DinB family protein n=1 Tax=Gorillibacterium massiliense TaxID=1280390 RepID=UPI0004BA1D0C|nr:DinB family protein [Gorillibacterium massiliense]